MKNTQTITMNSNSKVNNLILNGRKYVYLDDEIKNRKVDK